MFAFIAIFNSGSGNSYNLKNTTLVGFNSIRDRGNVIKKFKYTREKQGETADVYFVELVIS